MIRGGATIAIVHARLRRDAAAALVGIGACALLGYLQRYDAQPVRLAGAIGFGTLVAIVSSLLQRGRAGHMELCERAAPLFGRELARATALVPCVIACCASAAYWIVAAAYALPPAADIGLTLAAVNLAALFSLRATLERGAARWFWLIVACAAAGAIYAMQKAPVAIAIGAAAVALFAALRQYGEALAREDPLDGLSRGGGGEFF